jgi:hypothetical protein
VLLLGQQLLALILEKQDEVESKNNGICAVLQNQALMQLACKWN